MELEEIEQMEEMEEMEELWKMEEMEVEEMDEMKELYDMEDLALLKGCCGMGGAAGGAVKVGCNGGGGEPYNSHARSLCAADRNFRNVVMKGTLIQLTSTQIIFYVTSFTCKREL